MPVYIRTNQIMRRGMVESSPSQDWELGMLAERRLASFSVLGEDVQLKAGMSARIAGASVNPDMIQWRVYGKFDSPYGHISFPINNNHMNIGAASGYDPFGHDHEGKAGVKDGSYIEGMIHVDKVYNRIRYGSPEGRSARKKPDSPSPDGDFTSDASQANEVFNGRLRAADNQFADGNYQDALASYRKARLIQSETSGLTPDNYAKAPYLQYQIALTYLKLGQRKQALEAFALFGKQYPKGRLSSEAERYLAELKKER